MASKTNPKTLAALLLVLVAAVVVGVIQLRPSLLPGGGSAVGTPQVGSYKVPSLGKAPAEAGELSADKTGRNLFAFGAPPTPTPDLRPTPTPRPTLPPPPPPPPTATPIYYPKPPPPAFTMTYVGWLGPNRLPVAVFKDGEDVVAVAQGGTIKDKFIVRKVDLLEVTIGYVGYPESVTKNVPLVK